MPRISSAVLVHTHDFGSLFEALIHLRMSGSGAEEAASQAADNEWGPGASDIHCSLLSRAADEPMERGFP